ncbi:MAG: arylesterase [Alphaproteobacteria bacterium]|nr:arylesterase [Alphaproteobacteria bacterium]
MKPLSYAKMRDSVSRLYGSLRCTINGLLLVFCLVFGGLGIGHAAAETTILALGDSLTAGYGLSKAESFPNKLEAALKKAGRDVRVINGGVSGDTSKGGLSRVDWLFADKPELMILELGANDGLRGLPPSETRKNLAAIIEKAQAAGVKVLLTGMMAPPNLGREYSEEFNAVFPGLAEEYNTLFYPFFLDGVVADANLNQGDGMHPTGAGVDVIVTRILPIVQQALDDLGQKGAS